MDLIGMRFSLALRRAHGGDTRRVSAWLVAASLLLVPVAAQAQSMLVVGTYGGALGAAIRKVYEPFQRQYDVTIRWQPGVAIENLGRVVVAREHPEFDLTFGDDKTLYAGTGLGVWQPIDDAKVPHTGELFPAARVPDRQGVLFGFFLGGLYYRMDEFLKRGWAPPVRLTDLFRPEFCGRVGINNANVAYGLDFLLLLAGGDPNRVPDAIAQLAAHKECIPLLEPTPASLEEKIERGDYLVGWHGNIRVIPLIRKGLPLALRYLDRTVVDASSLAVVKGTRNPELAQAFVDWIIRPAAQTELLRTAFYAPANATVPVPSDLAALGVPDASLLQHVLPTPQAAIAAHRHEWIDALDRAMKQ